MRCLQINKFWYRRAGADIYALDLADALASRGLEVGAYATAHPQNLPHPDAWSWPPYSDLSAGGRSLSLFHKASEAAAILYRPSARRTLSRLLDRHRTDVAHVHNFTKHLTAAPVLELRRRGVPVVATLHDYWPVCPSYSLVQGDGARCDWECARFGASRCIRHRCITNAVGPSLMGAVEQSFRNLLGWNLELFDAVVSPSRFLADHVFASRDERNRQIVISHPRPRYPWAPLPEGGPLRVFYAGRLAREKGVHVLVSAATNAPAAWELVIAGAGPAEKTLRAAASGHANVRFLGFVSTADVIREMRAAHVVVIPSVWYENAPLVLLEALATGRVVVASAIGGIPEYAAGIDGVRLVEPGNVEELRATIDALAERRRDLTPLARSAWEASQAAPGWPEHLARIIGVYSDLGAR